MATSLSRLWRGKKRDASGMSSGVAIPLELVGDGYFNAVYTFPLQLGSNNQNVSVQVDTGSADLWLASSSCTSSSCTSIKSQLYNPTSSSSSVSTGQNFDIQYLSGEVIGPIYVDNVGVGGMGVQSQAFAAANSIQNEPLSSGFSGVLGLALPSDSIIAQDLQSSSSSSSSSTGNGNSILANLFGLSSTNTNAGGTNSGGRSSNSNNNNNDIVSTSSPISPFIGISLSRPVAPLTSSILTIGMHPSSISLSSGDAFPVNAGGISYTPVIPDTVSGTYLQWMGSVTALTAFVGGVEKVIDLSSALSGGGVTAVVDSGSPVILMMPSLASGVWDAVGVSPAADGNYYLPCVTPLNMTITFSGLPPIPLHPLDLSSPSTNDPSGNTCTGLIQQNSALGSFSSSSGDSNGNIGGTGSSNTIANVDIVLGVPFLRNLYTVLALEEPNADGSFAPVSGSASGGASGSNLNLRNLNPYMGFLTLSNESVALEEFRTVRVLHGSLGPSSSSASSSSNGGDLNKEDAGGKGFSPGLSVLFALLGFAALCAVVFLGWWVYMRRRIRREGEKGGDGFGAGVDAGDAKLKEQELEDVGKDEPGGEKEELTLWSKYRHNFGITRKDSAAFSDDTLRGSVFGEAPGDSLKMKRRPSNLNLDDTADDMDEVLMRIRWTFEDLPSTPKTAGSSWSFDGTGGVGSSSRPSTADLTIPEKAAFSSNARKEALHSTSRLGGEYGHVNTSSISSELVSGINTESSQNVPLLVHTPDSPPISEAGLMTLSLPPDIPPKENALSVLSGRGKRSWIEPEFDFEPESGPMAGIGTHSRASKISFRYDPEPYEDYFSMTPKTTSGFNRDFVYGSASSRNSDITLIKEEVVIPGAEVFKYEKPLVGDRTSVGTFGFSSGSGLATSPVCPEFRLSELNPPVCLTASEEDKETSSSTGKRDDGTCDGGRTNLFERN